MRYPVFSPGSFVRPGGQPEGTSARRARRSKGLFILLFALTIVLLLAPAGSRASGSDGLRPHTRHPDQIARAPVAPERPELLGIGRALALLDAGSVSGGLAHLAVSLQPASTPTSHPTATPEPAAEPPQRPVATIVLQAEPSTRAAPPALSPTPTNPPAPPPASCPAVSMTGFERDLFGAINGERARRGLPELSVDDCGAYIARLRSSEMASRGYFSHTSPTGATMAALLGRYDVPYSQAGEDLARNNYPYDESVAVAVRGLMESDAHRAIVLDNTYTHLGVGFADDGSGTKYYALIFIGF